MKLKTNFTTLMKNLYKQFHLFNSLIQSKLLPIIITCLFCLAFLPKARATHQVGAEITYKCIGKDSFEVTLTLYRDCNGINLPSTESVKISSNGALLTSVNVNLVSTKDITPVCPTTLSRCQSSSGFIFGIQKFVYTGIVDLGAYPNNCDITFYNLQCCRNGSLVVGKDQNYYAETKMDKCASSCNSSPVFSQERIGVVYTGQNIKMFQSANDVDGDSLVYKLIPVRQTATSTVTYSSGYTYLQPLGTKYAFSYDSITGLVSFESGIGAATSVAYQVEEWGRNTSGNMVKKGSIMRESILYVYSGTNKTPTISGINGSSSDTLTICKNINTCFTINSSDLDKNDTVKLSWDNVIPGATFTTSSAKFSRGTFCWQPTPAQVRDEPYIFKVTAKDNFCPLYGATQKQFVIYVKSGFPAYNYSKKQTGCAKYNFHVSSDGASKVTVNWKINGNSVSADSILNYQFKGVGTYNIQGILSAPSATCNAYINDTVVINYLPNVNAGNPLTICYGDTTQLKGTGGKTYKWSPADGLSDPNIANPLASPKVTTTYQLTATDSNGCENTSSVKITVLKPNTTVSASKTITCEDGPVALSASGGNLYVWTPGTGLTNRYTSNPTARPKQTTTYYVEITDFNGCTITDSVTVKVIKPQLFTSGHATICNGDSVRIFATGAISNKYSWSPATGLSNANIANPYAKPSANTNYVITVTDTNGCTNTDTVKITVTKDCVWPGDANNDKVVNVKDLLPIGVAYNTKGLKRPNASINWRAQYAPNWKDTFSGGINYKHADCNGDSIINLKDANAILANYSFTHNKTNGNAPAGPNDPTLQIKFQLDSLKPRDTAIAYINYGTAAIQAKDIYGLAFTLNYDPKLVDSGSFALNLKNSWLFNDTNYIYMIKDFYNLGKLDVAMTRKDKKSKSGYGPVGTLQFVIIDNIAGKRDTSKTLTLTLSDVQIINEILRDQLFNTEDGSAVITQVTTGIYEVENAVNKLKVYPNPAKEQLTIEITDHKISHLKLVNMLGQTVIQKNIFNSDKTTLQTAELESGIYILSVITSEGVISKTVLIEK